MIFAGRDESEQHLRGEHFEEYKSLFARECFLKTRHHEKYREWEAQEVYIEGLTFCNLDEMETHGRKRCVGHLLIWKVQIKLKVPKKSSHKSNCMHFTKVKVNQTKFR